MNSNNQMKYEVEDLAADFQACNCSDADTREDQDEMMQSSSEIFRDLPDADYTPIERSNDTLYMSPAWSLESFIMEDAEELKAAAVETTTTAPSSSQSMYLNAGPAPSSLVTRISDFDMNSGTVQRLNF